MKTLTTTLLISLALAPAPKPLICRKPRAAPRSPPNCNKAKASGQYTFGELDYPPALPQATSLSSQQVSDELQQAKINGQYTFGELQYRPSPPPRDQDREVARRRAGRTGAGQGQRPVHLRRAGIPADRALNRPSGELLAVARPASDGIMVRGRFFSYDKRMQYRRGRDAAVFTHRNRPPRPRACGR